MGNRNYRIRSLSLLSCLLLLGVLVLANVVFARVNTRIDLTEEKQFTLSQATSKVLGKLQDPLSIKMFWKDVPSYYDAPKERIVALLDELENETDNLTVQWVDMEDDSAEEEARKLGVNQHIMQAPEGNEIRTTKGYMSLVLETGADRPMVIDGVALQVDTLEYDLMAEIVRRTREDSPVFGVYIRRGAMQERATATQLGYGRITRYLSQIADPSGGTSNRFAPSSHVRDNIDLKRPVPQAVDVLLVLAPDNLSDQEVYHVEQFLLNGGRVILLLDPVHAQAVLGRSQGTIRESGFESWLEHLGVTVERGVVADTANGAVCRLPLRQRMGIELREHPFWLRILESGISPEATALQGLKGFPVFWPSAIALDEDVQQKAGRHATVWLSTSSEGVRRKSITGLLAPSLDFEGASREAIPLAVYIDGPATSFWKGKFKKEEPKDDGAESGEDDKEGIPAFPGGDDEGGEGEGGNKGDGDSDGDDPDNKGDNSSGEDAAKPDEDAKPDEGEKPSEEESAPQQMFDGPPQVNEGRVQLLVMSDAEFAQDQFTSDARSGLAQINGEGGVEAIVSTMLWMAGGDDLMELRTRQPKLRKLDKTEVSTQKTIKYASLFGIPLLLALCGLVVFFLRRN